MIGSIFGLFVNFQAFLARNIVAEYFVGSIYNVESLLGLFNVVLILVRMHQHRETSVLFFY